MANPTAALVRLGIIPNRTTASRLRTGVLLCRGERFVRVSSVVVHADGYQTTIMGQAGGRGWAWVFRNDETVHYLAESVEEDLRLVVSQFAAR